MKKVLRKINKYIGGIQGLLAVIYLAVVLFLSTITTDVAVSLSDNSRVLYNIATVLLRNLFFALLISALVCPIIIKKINENKYNIIKSLEKTDDIAAFRIVFFIVPFIVFIINYIAFYPGGFSPDSINQYEQVINNSYDDWHPALQTLLVFKMPLLLTNGWLGSIVLFQIFGFTAVIYYAVSSIYRYTNKTVALIILALLILNPNTFNIAMLPWKDTTFAILCLLLISYIMNIVLTSGDWIKKPLNTAAFCIVLSLTTIVRHNALLFTVPLIFALFFFISKKRAVAIAMCSVAIIAGINGPIYNVLNVEKASQSQEELLGLPMTVIGAVATYDYDCLDEETKQFVDAIAPRDVWDTYYKYGSFNDVKWSGRSNDTVINQYSSKSILKMMMRCFIKSPLIAFTSLVKLTESAYSISADFNRFVKPASVGNKYGIEMQGIPALRAINLAYVMLCDSITPHLFMYTGAMHLILIFIILSKGKINKIKNMKYALLCLPVFIYNFGTALALTGAEDTTRFFFYTFPITPIYVFTFFKANE